MDMAGFEFFAPCDLLDGVLGGLLPPVELETALLMSTGEISLVLFLSFTSLKSVEENGFMAARTTGDLAGDFLPTAEMATEAERTGLTGVEPV